MSTALFAIGRLAFTRSRARTGAYSVAVPLNEPPGDPRGYELAYQEGIRALTAQADSLSGLRTRSGVVLTAASIVAGFLGPTPPEHLWLALLAAVFFVASASAAIFPLLPIGRWRSTTNAKDVVTKYVEGTPPASIAWTHRSLAWYMQDDWQANEDMLVFRNRVLVIAAGLLVLETVTWIAAIYGGVSK